MQIMDDMNIDSVSDVPDTPDRLIAQTNSGKSMMERESNLSASKHSGQCNCFIDDTRNEVKVNERGSRKFLIHAPPKSSSSKHDSHSNLAFASGNSSSYSSNRSSIFRRVRGEILNYENKHLQPTEYNNQFHTQSSSGHVVDLTEQDGHVQASKGDKPYTGQRNSRAEGYGKSPRATSRLPFSSNKGKEPNNKASGFGSDGVIGSVTETQSEAGKVVPSSLNSFSASRVSGQKRLVRNGCISPHNIAKSKQEVEVNKNRDLDDVPNPPLPVASSALQIPASSESSIKHIGSHKSKGKGIMMTDPLSVKESDAPNTQTRNAVTIDGIVKEAGYGNKDRFGGLEELGGGWRSTRNRSKKMDLPVFNEHQDFSVERDPPCSVDRVLGNGLTRRKCSNSSGSSNNFPMNQGSISSQSASMLPPRSGASGRTQVDQCHGHQARTMLTKRQKQGSSSSTQGESSSTAMDDSDIVFLGSAGNASKSSSTQTQTRNCLGTLGSVIEIDKTSHEVRGDGISAAGSSPTDTDAMARQIQADEILARELQEQFYNEIPSVEIGVDDMHVAMALQGDESLTHAFPRSQQLFSPRTSLMPSSTRPPQSRSSLNLSRRNSQARGSSLSRMARLRSRFPGRPRTISSPSSSSSSSLTGRNSLFPPGMDVDMRMYILEALEAFSDMGVDNNFLHIQREFNENDYEMLLALDENNHQHGGATDRQINGLPHSTVQSDNFEESCAICLETPSIGDIIRHLPCLHKFHKDCIDPWLRRRTSCPVCKSSIS